MTELEFKDNLSFETMRYECLRCDCEFLDVDYDEVEDSDGILNPVETWWCGASEGCFCPRLEKNLKFYD